MTKISFAALLLVSVLFLQCRHDHFQPAYSYTVNPDPISASLQGVVLDENGQPAAGVTVESGLQTTQTDARGYFHFHDAQLDKISSMVSAQKTGYFKAYRSFGATSGSNQVMIQLIKKTLAGSVNSSSGGSVSLSNGTKIELASNSIIKASDQSVYSGTVQVYASYIDPTSSTIGRQVPGSFMGDDKDGSRVLLQSYGMMAVELESTTGEKLQVKPGTQAILTMPIPSAMTAAAPASIPLWFIDETKGVWKEQGSASKQGNNYVGSVQHFSFWNCDLGFPTIHLSMTLHHSNNQPMSHARVRIRRPGPNGVATYGWTDSLGQVSGLVPYQEQLTLEVLDPCDNVIYSQSIGPYTTTTDLGVITVTTPANSFVTISGHLTDCNGGSVTNGYAVIWYSNQVMNAPTDASGNFSTSFAVCSGATGTAEVFGFDLSTHQQGNTITSNISAPTTNVGNLSACGQSASQFMNYTLDNHSYAINDLHPGDSLVGWAGPTGNIIISNFVGTQPPQPGNMIAFSFQQPLSTTTGSFPISSLYVQEYPTASVIPIQPFNVNVTNFPSVVGQYYEGNFTGQFRDLNQVIHNVSCSYRVRKNQ